MDGQLYIEQLDTLINKGEIHTKAAHFTKAVEMFLKQKNRRRSYDANRQKKSKDDTQKR